MAGTLNTRLTLSVLGLLCAVACRSRPPVENWSYAERLDAHATASRPLAAATPTDLGPLRALARQNAPEVRLLEARLAVLRALEPHAAPPARTPELRWAVSDSDRLEGDTAFQVGLRVFSGADGGAGELQTWAAKARIQQAEAELALARWTAEWEAVRSFRNAQAEQGRARALQQRAHALGVQAGRLHDQSVALATTGRAGETLALTTRQQRWLADAQAAGQRARDAMETLARLTGTAVQPGTRLPDASPRLTAPPWTASERHQHVRHHPLLRALHAELNADILETLADSVRASPLYNHLQLEYQEQADDEQRLQLSGGVDLPLVQTVRQWVRARPPDLREALERQAAVRFGTALADQQRSAERAWELRQQAGEAWNQFEQALQPVLDQARAERDWMEGSSGLDPLLLSELNDAIAQVTLERLARMEALVQAEIDLRLTVGPGEPPGSHLPASERSSE